MLNIPKQSHIQLQMFSLVAEWVIHWHCALQQFRNGMLQRKLAMEARCIARQDVTLELKTPTSRLGKQKSMIDLVHSMMCGCVPDIQDTFTVHVVYTLHMQTNIIKLVSESCSFSTIIMPLINSHSLVLHGHVE